jgi:hypothetical protein
MIRLGCSGKLIDMRLSRRGPALDKVPLIVVKAGDRDVYLGAARAWSDSNGNAGETRGARVPSYFLDRAVARESVELIEAASYAAVSTPIHRTSLSTAGFAPLLGALLQKCQ